MLRRRLRLGREARRALLESYGGRCAYCGCPLSLAEMQADHVDSLHNRGADTPDNLVPSCRSCNHLKGACSLEGFRRRLARVLRNGGWGGTGDRARNLFGTDWCRRFWFEVYWRQRLSECGDAEPGETD